MNFLQNSISFLGWHMYVEHIFLFTKLYRGENQKVFLYITVTNIKGDFFAIFNFKKKILFIGENRKQKKILEGEIFLRVFLETHFPIFFQIQIVCMCMYLLHAA